MKTKFAPLVAALTLFAVAACSDSSSSSSDEETGPVALTYWSWAPNMDKVVAAWNAKNPDIQVTVNKQDGGDPAVTKLLTAIKAGSGAPDIMQAEYQKIPTLVSADAIIDISCSRTGSPRALNAADRLTAVAASTRCCASGGQHGTSSSRRVRVEAGVAGFDMSRV